MKGVLKTPSEKAGFCFFVCTFFPEWLLHNFFFGCLKSGFNFRRQQKIFFVEVRLDTVYWNGLNSFRWLNILFKEFLKVFCICAALVCTSNEACFSSFLI